MSSAEFYVRTTPSSLYLSNGRAICHRIRLLIYLAPGQPTNIVHGRNADAADIFNNVLTCDIGRIDNLHLRSMVSRIPFSNVPEAAWLAETKSR
jgi:hypothetical protein